VKHLFVAGAAVLVLAGCTSNPDSTEDATPVAVTSSDSACEVMPTQAPAGTVVFSVQNTGGQATEFYLLRDNDEVVAEVENIGPGVARDLVVDVEAGDYVTSCKPGMTGDGIRGDFSVVDQ
jgi:iron uptake system component EfeO